MAVNKIETIRIWFYPFSDKYGLNFDNEELLGIETSKTLDIFFNEICQETKITENGKNEIFNEINNSNNLKDIICFQHKSTANESNKKFLQEICKSSYQELDNGSHDYNSNYDGNYDALKDAIERYENVNN